MASDDEGATWQPVFEGFGDVPPGSGGRIRCLGLTAVGADKLMASLSWVDRSDPTLPLFNPQTEGILPTRVLFVESEDGGRSWTEPVEVPLLPHRGNAITGSIMVLGDGRLALPYEAWKDYEDTGPGKHHASLRFSPDRGKTWPELAVVAHDPAGRVLYWDQRMAVDPASGRLIAMFWSHDRQAKHALDMEIRNQFSLLPGTDVEVIAEKSRVLIVKARPKNAFSKWVGRGKASKGAIDMTVERLRGRTDD